VVELRSQIVEDMRAVREQIKAYASAREKWQVETIYEKDSVQLAEPLICHIISAAKSTGLSWTSMQSGAGHDAQSFAPFVPTGMIFVPCLKGVSHNPAESITPANATNGCQVLLKTLLNLADDE
jgi:acetylornithine deacetylase/succinyl-diaminopimelate desuccinylase-like protein